WYSFGSFVVQPVEFTKITVALAVARLMSNYNYSIKKLGDLVHVGFIILLPLIIIILQNDTGSGIVLCSFIFVLYREGLNKWICIPAILVAALFIFSFLFTPLFLLMILVLIFTFSNAMMIGQWKAHIIFLAAIALCSFSLFGISTVFWDEPLSGYASLAITVIAAAVLAVIFAFRKNISAIFLSVGLFIGSMLFVPTADKIFESVLQPHQKLRILSFLGIMSDPRGADYNVNQAKIAIGSGGLFGKGFMEGTQNRYFVPEKETDFIFCTVGEEWGFLGALFVLGLLCALILRLMKMGERQEEPFGRIYSYCVASILLFHVLVNIGMTVGLMPVMGIPLPFLSYGGSSLVAFTILVFIAIRLDASPRNGLMHVR
ncbi:MAG: rod shape-determining protein RodA, partial [Alistipes sp.]|nr:rod shape-determining protein RodA [Alistipes sp.]